MGDDDDTHDSIPRKKIDRYSRGGSIMEIEDNPFLSKKKEVAEEAASAGPGNASAEILVDSSMVDAKPISEEDFYIIVLGPMLATINNVDRLDMLDKLKTPYLFSSAHLIKVCELTPSIKTKIEMIKMLGPRLVDPTAESGTLLDMFRFSEEKAVVEKVLKDRNLALSNVKFTSRQNSLMNFRSTSMRGSMSSLSPTGRISPTPSRPNNSDKQLDTIFGITRRPTFEATAGETAAAEAVAEASSTAAAIAATTPTSANSNAGTSSSGSGI